MFEFAWWWVWFALPLPLLFYFLPPIERSAGAALRLPALMPSETLVGRTQRRSRWLLLCATNSVGMPVGGNSSTSVAG